MTRVALWRVPLTLSADAALLSGAERERAARFVFAPDREQWTAARAGLRRVLSVYLDCEPAAVRFSLLPGGKPRLSSDMQHARVRFNLSHTQGLALVAVTEGIEVGVDVEHARTDVDPLTLGATVLAPDELNYLTNAPEAKRSALFLTLWTAKEAVLKADGTGLLVPPASFSVLPIVTQEAADVRGLHVQTLPVRDGYFAALALPEPAFVIWHDLCNKRSASPP